MRILQKGVLKYSENPEGLCNSCSQIIFLLSLTASSNFMSSFLVKKRDEVMIVIVIGFYADSKGKKVVKFYCREVLLVSNNFLITRQLRTTERGDFNIVFIYLISTTRSLNTNFIILVRK